MELPLLCEQRDAGVPDDQREAGGAQDAVLAKPSGVLEQLERLRLAATAGQRNPERSVIAKDAANPVEDRDQARRRKVPRRAQKARLRPTVGKLTQERERVCGFDAPAHGCSSSWFAWSAAPVPYRALSNSETGSSAPIAGAVEADGGCSRVRRTAAAG
jgi:hypothetical protein